MSDTQLIKFNFAPTFNIKRSYQNQYTMYRQNIPRMRQLKKHQIMEDLMKKLPKTVTILGLKHKIITKPNKKVEAILKEGGDDYNLYGLYMGETNTIYINPTKSKEMQWRTLLHECFHALITRNGIRFTCMLDPQVEELLAETGSNCYFEIIEEIFGKFYE